MAVTSGSIAVLREIPEVTQDDPSIRRRWFHNDYFDLFVLETGGELAAFELCYGIDASERALVWSQARGYFHDGGTSTSGDFIGARLADGDPLEADPIIARFERDAAGLPRALQHSLMDRLREYALQSAEGAARRKSFRRAAWQTGAKQNPKTGRD